MEIYNDTYCVYVHTNKTNGKKYVGQTVYGDNPNKRWSNGNRYKYNTHFWSAIQKYGWDNFEHEVVASNLTLSEANNFEELLIKTLDTMDQDNGYNLTSGGGARLLSEETKQRISNAHKGKKLSESTKRKIGDASRGRNVGRKYTESTLQKMRGNTNWKRKHSEESKRKMQDSSPNKKAVLQKDKNGNVLNQYNSLASASRATGISFKTISSCCHHYIKISGGFIWEFV